MVKRIQIEKVNPACFLKKKNSITTHHIDNLNALIELNHCCLFCVFTLVIKANNYKLLLSNCVKSHILKQEIKKKPSLFAHKK